jgi:hypothetical protein
LRVERLVIDCQVREDPLDEVGLADARDHPKPATAAKAPLDLDGEDALQALSRRYGAATLVIGCGHIGFLDLQPLLGGI